VAGVEGLGRARHGRLIPDLRRSGNPPRRQLDGAIPNYGERRRYAEPISTAFIESTVNLVIGKRFAKKQQMQWSKAGAHLLLQTRTQTLDGTLRETFRKWYPAMAANDTPTPAAAA
jgi:hypothetical protein